jgi:hypothetical protein
VEPALIRSSKHLATLCAVSPIRFKCAIGVGPRNIWVVTPNSGEPWNAMLPAAYCCPGRTSS